MNVSKTELTALLKQVFEALGFSSGEHQNAAEMVVWAQMCGLEGLPELRRGLPRAPRRAPLCAMWYQPRPCTFPTRRHF